MKTLLDLFWQACTQSPGQGHVNFWTRKEGNHIYSYPQLWQMAAQVRAGLQQQGIKSGDRVAIALPTGPEFYAAIFGTMMMGAIPAALYPPLRLGKLDEWREKTTKLLQSISARIVLTDSLIYPFLGPSVLQAPVPLGCCKVSSLLNNNSSPQSQSQSQSQPLRHDDISINDVALIQFSSGSTGLPRPVALSHQSILSNCYNIRKIFNPAPGEVLRLLSWLPLYHDMGLVGCLFTPLTAPVEVTLMRPEEFVSRPRTWMEAITQQRAQIIVAPNFAFSLCTSKIPESELSQYDLSSIKVALSGAETIHPATVRSFCRKFAASGFNPDAFLSAYGMAEATLAVSCGSLQQPPRFKTFQQSSLQEQQQAQVLPTPAAPLGEVTEIGLELTSLGHPLPETTIKILDEQKRTLPEGHVGTVYVQSPSLAYGLWQGVDAHQQPIFDTSIFHEGFLNTGDRGFFHQGELYLCGRVKDIIIIRGSNIDPSHIEFVVGQLPQVRSGCALAFGVFDEMLGTEKIVVLAEWQNPDVDIPQVTDTIQKTVLANLQLPVAGVLLLAPGTIPRTSSGKLRRREAKEMYLAQKWTVPKKVHMAYLLKENIKGQWHHFLHKKEKNENC